MFYELKNHLIPSITSFQSEFEVSFLQGDSLHGIGSLFGFEEVVFVVDGMDRVLQSGIKVVHEKTIWDPQKAYFPPETRPH